MNCISVNNKKLQQGQQVTCEEQGNSEESRKDCLVNFVINCDKFNLEKPFFGVLVKRKWIIQDYNQFWN